jgi:hypothetical protein
MDDSEIETTLSAVIDQFVVLQKLAAKAEVSRSLNQIFPVILGVREKLKRLERMNRSHPLYGLLREVRSEFDTREFRAVLLAAFNWRSAAKKRAAALVAKKRLESMKFTAKTRTRAPGANVKMRDVQLRHATSKAAKPAAIQPARETAARTEQDPATIEELTQNILAFLDKSFRILGDAGIPSLKRRVGDDIDFYRAGHRLPGSYGSNQ